MEIIQICLGKECAQSIPSSWLMKTKPWQWGSAANLRRRRLTSWPRNTCITLVSCPPSFAQECTTYISSMAQPLRVVVLVPWHSTTRSRKQQSRLALLVDGGCTKAATSRCTSTTSHSHTDGPKSRTATSRHARLKHRTTFRAPMKPGSLSDTEKLSSSRRWLREPKEWFLTLWPSWTASA